MKGSISYDDNHVKNPEKNMLALKDIIIIPICCCETKYILKGKEILGLYGTYGHESEKRYLKKSENL